MTFARIQLRRDTAANWTLADTVLSSGEFGFEVDTFKYKVGDGLTAWTSLAYESSLIPNATKASPNLISAATGIAISGHLREVQFIAGNGGPIDPITHNPQIQAGVTTGQELIIQGTNDTNYVTLNNGTGLDLNGPCKLVEGSRIYLMWDGTLWGEVSRNDI